MGTILESFDFGRNGRGRGRYDWDGLLDGQIHQVTAEDLGGDIPKHFGSQARLNAEKRDLKVRLKHDTKEGVVVMQAYNADGSEIEREAVMAGEDEKPTRRRK